MKSMQQQLGILRTISICTWRQRKTKKICVELAGRRTFRVRTDF